jgi:hypothetical protein
MILQSWSRFRIGVMVREIKREGSIVRVRKEKREEGGQSDEKK